MKVDIDYKERNLQLKELQEESLNMKIQLTIAKVMEFWLNTNHNCYLSYSGGADSTVLLDIITRYVEPMLDCKIKKVFDDTGLEDPSVKQMAISQQDICVVRPNMSFLEVLTKIGYPIISKEVSECIVQARKALDNPNRERDIYRLEKMLGTAKKKDGTKSLYNKEKYKPLLNAPFRISNECCNIMKKKPMGKLKEKPIIATMTEESNNRKTAWLKTGCNSFDKKIASRPISFWTKQDILQYIKEKNIKIADCYGEIISVDKSNSQTFEETQHHLLFSGVQRTGCIFCLFGLAIDSLNNGVNRFEMLRRTQPQLFDYCMRGGKFDEQGLWIPDKGLGLAFVIEWLNRTLSKKLLNGKTSLYIKGLNLADYKKQIEDAFKKLEEIESTRKKWLKE